MRQRISERSRRRHAGPRLLAAFAFAALLSPIAAVGFNKGKWGPVIKFPLVPVAATVLPTNKLLVWSSFSPTAGFAGGYGYTVTATMDLKTEVVTERIVSNTGHDMFCPGAAALADGRILVSGGSNAEETSIYSPASDSWAASGVMNIPRGYQSNTLLSDGRVFTIGGSWSGDVHQVKKAEVWLPATGKWTVLPNIDPSVIYTTDFSEGLFKADNHAWLFALEFGAVFHAGPSSQMNFFGTVGGGKQWSAGKRGSDPTAQYGNAVMFEPYKILTVGGATQQDTVRASARAHVITLNGFKMPTVKATASMAFGRAFANSVVLPDGDVLVIGGQRIPHIFSDSDAVQIPELWNHRTGTWRQLARQSIPRTYHSVAVLLPDGRVFSGGGGLCNPDIQSFCPPDSKNHLDGQIFTPPYLLEADGSPAPRPVITVAPPSAIHGAKISVHTSSPITSIVIVRTGVATHSVNNDQRRVPLQIVDTIKITATNIAYAVQIPPSTGLALSGYYILFALNSRGVPSVGKFIRIGKLPPPPPPPAPIQTCQLVGKDFPGTSFYVGSEQVPPESVPRRLEFCRNLLIQRIRTGSANAVFVSDGAIGHPYHNTCFFKQAPVAAAYPVANTYFPKGTLIIEAGVAGVNC